MLTPERRALLQKRLTEAEEAYHSLTIGGAARVFVDQNGERIEYAPTSAGTLYKYITLLRHELTPTISGPISPWM